MTGAMFRAFYLGVWALETLDEMELRRFGSAVLIALLLQVIGEWLLLLKNPHRRNEWIKNVKSSCFRLVLYVVLVLLVIALQVALARSAFMLAEDPNIRMVASFLSASRTSCHHPYC